MRDVDVFLFDEPLSNLDAKLRTELRVELKRLHQRLGKATMIYVTHDQIEALTLADRIAVMHGGVIQQLDTPQNIYSRPVNRFVAGFVGSPTMNFIEGTLETGASPVFRSGELAIPLSRYQFEGKPAAGGKCELGIRPEHIAFAGAGSALPFSREIEVEIVEPMGSQSLVWTKLGTVNFAFLVDSESQLKVGDRGAIGFDPARASLFDGASGDRL